MHPIIIEIGALNIYSYGVMVALGFGLATILILKNSKKFNVEPDKIIDIAILILVSGIIGARLFYVLLNISYYKIHFVEILNLAKGGLVWYGGFISAVAFLLFYLKINKMDFWAVTDLIAPYVFLAQAFGRIGCFLNGCCYGIKINPENPFAVMFPGDYIARHPTQIYDASVLFILFFVLLFWRKRRRFSGEIFLGYGLLYSFERFLMEFLRGDNPRIFFHLTISQVISLAVFVLCAVVFINRYIKYGRRKV